MLENRKGLKKNFREGFRKSFSNETKAIIKEDIEKGILNLGPGIIGTFPVEDPLGRSVNEVLFSIVREGKEEYGDFYPYELDDLTYRLASNKKEYYLIIKPESIEKFKRAVY